MGLGGTLYHRLNAAASRNFFQPRGIRRRNRRQTGDDSGVLYTGPVFGALNRIVERLNSGGSVLIPGGI